MDDLVPPPVAGVRVIRLDTARVAALDTTWAAADWREALQEAGYLTPVGDDPLLRPLDTIQRALGHLEETETKLAIHRHGNPIAVGQVAWPLYALMLAVFLASWVAGWLLVGRAAAFLFAAVVSILTFGVVGWLGLGWYQRYRRAWSRREEQLAEERIELRAALRRTVDEANGRAWIAEGKNSRIVSAPDLDWLRSCRRRRLDRDPRDPLDAEVREEIRRIERLIEEATRRDVDATELETDRARWD